jgi:hypothetical protein
MKTEENHIFTTFDFFTLVLSLVVIVAISAPIINKNFQPDNSVERAKVSLNEIGHVILSPQTLMVLAQNYKANGGRAIASVDDKSTTPAIDLASIQKHLKSGEWEGDVGKDPWGRPYHFSFIRNAAGMRTHVAVWSDGPNQINDSDVKSKLTSVEHPEALKFHGDDVGTVFPIR